MSREVRFDSLVGRTLARIEDCNEASECVTFTDIDGAEFEMFHRQDCCETVELAEVIGDVSDLIGTPILQAEEASEQADKREYGGSQTWTFYKLATIKGSVTLRWLGESNGYYSETVDFHQTKWTTADKVAARLKGQMWADCVSDDD